MTAGKLEGAIHLSGVAAVVDWNLAQGVGRKEAGNLGEQDLTASVNTRLPFYSLR